MSGTTAQLAATDRLEGVLRMADDSLILSHRIAEWTSRAPQIEEDLALVNIALDLLGQARHLLTFAADIQGEGNTEDDLAFLREEHEFRNVILVEQPTLHEYAKLVAVLFYFSAYSVPLYEHLTQSRDSRLVEIAAKSLKEVLYHREHAASWVIRLGDGTQESHVKMQQAIDEFWPIAGDLFEVDEVTERLAGGGFIPHPSVLKTNWEATLREVLTEAALSVPSRGFRQGTGRQGVHSEYMGYLLAEMQYVHRLHPGATW